MSQPSSASASTAGGGTTERVDHGDLKITKHIDKASPKLYESLSKGTHIPNVVIEFCRAGMPSVKRPRKIVFVDHYPMTATGKIRRVELRAMAATVLLDGPAEVPV